MEDSLCEKEFLRIGLSFWTGQIQGGSLALDFLTTLDCHTAASVGDLQFISELPQAQLDCSNWSGWTPLMYASYQGHLAVVSSLLARGCGVSKTNNKGRSVSTNKRPSPGWRIQMSQAKGLLGLKELYSCFENFIDANCPSVSQTGQWAGWFIHHLSPVTQDSTNTVRHVRQQRDHLTVPHLPSHLRTAGRC